MNQIAKGCREEFYNFKGLCDAALHEDMESAREVFLAQSSCLFTEKQESREEMVLFLNSMNRSFYNYILYAMNISLHQCCFENGCMIRHCQCKKDFFKMAEVTIKNYVRLLEKAASNNRYIVQAQDYIAHNLDRPLTLEEVASHVFISKAYLSELFPVCTGKSFTAYVNDCRMKLARQMLTSTSLSIQDVGQACGFYSPAYFSTAFTRQFGMSPRRYRTARQNERKLGA